MNYRIVLMSLALGALPLSGCAEGTRGSLYMGMSYPYYGYYDGYYGPIYDGYWGTNDYFYYRLDRDGRFHRGSRDHFRRERHDNDSRFRPMQGNLRPQRNDRMPHFDGSRSRDGRSDKDRSHDRR